MPPWPRSCGPNARLVRRGRGEGPNPESDDPSIYALLPHFGWTTVSCLKGRLLTLIDATFTDPQQRKAQKDVVWQVLRSWMESIEAAAGHEPLGEPLSHVVPAE